MAERELTAKVKVEQEGDAKALDELVGGLRKLGPEADSAGGQVTTLTRSVGDLEAAARQVGSAFAAATPTEPLTRAEEAAGNVGSKLADLRSKITGISSASRVSFGAFVSAVSSARGSMDDLKDVLEGIDEDDLPGMRAELDRLEESFDRVFSRGAESSRHLGDVIEDASEKMHGIGDAADAGTGNVRNLGDAVSTTFPEMAAKAQVVTAAIETFKQTFDATRAAVDFLKDQFGIDVDEMVSKALHLQEVVEVFIRVGNSVEQDAELLRNQQRIFDNLNLDGFTSNVEANAELLDAHFRGIGATVSDAQTLLDRLHLNPQTLLAEAKELSEQFAATLTLNPDVDLSVLGDRLRGQIERILEGLRATGTAIPAEFAAIVDQLGVLTEESVVVVAKGVGKLAAAVDDGGAALKSSVARLLEDYKALPGGLVIPEDVRDKVRAELQVVVDAYAAAGQEVPPAVQQITAVLNELGAAHSDAAGQALVFSGANETLEGSSIKIVTRLNDEGAAVDTIVQKRRGAKAGVDELAAAQKAAGEQAAASADQQAAAADKIGEGGTAFKEGAAAAGEAASKAGEAATGIDAVGAATERLGELATAFGRIRDVLAKITDAVDALADVKISIDVSASRDAVAALKADLIEVQGLIHSINGGGGTPAAAPPAGTA